MTPKRPHHTYVLTVDAASLDAAKRNPALQSAIMARLLIFQGKHETKRLNGWHYMKRAAPLTSCTPTS